MRVHVYETPQTWGVFLDWLGTRPEEELARMPTFMGMFRARGHLAHKPAHFVFEACCADFIATKVGTIPDTAARAEMLAARALGKAAWFCGAIGRVRYPEGFAGPVKKYAPSNGPAQKPPSKRKRGTSFHAIAGEVPVGVWARAVLSLYCGIPDALITRPNPSWSYDNGVFRAVFGRRAYKCDGGGLGEALAIWASGLEDGAPLGACTSKTTVALACREVCSRLGWDFRYVRPPQKVPGGWRRPPQPPTLKVSGGFMEMAKALGNMGRGEIKRIIANAAKQTSRENVHDKEAGGKGDPGKANKPSPSDTPYQPIPKHLYPEPPHFGMDIPEDSGEPDWA
jgi:hypothetical protein